MRKILFAQPNFAVTPTQYYLPYSIGILWSFVRHHEDIRSNYECIDLLFKRAPIDEYVEQIEELDVAVFSCYLWNWEYNKALAKAIKAKFPQCLVLFGGPQVTDNPAKHLLFLSSNKYIDVIINGEGEHALLDILRQRLEGTVPERIIQTKRIANLDAIPSPYLSGVFDSIIESHPEVEWSMVWETTRGCPYQCTFCDWGSATFSKIKKFSLERVVAEFEWACTHRVGFIFMADANFGIFYERDKAIAECIAEIRKRHSKHIVINANWAKNQTSRTLEIAKIMSARSVTVSFQSTDAGVLETIKRDNMGINNLKEVLQASKDLSVPIYSELIIGLPGETLQSWNDGLYKLLEYGLHGNLESYFLVLLENAELNNQHSQHEYDIIKAEYTFGMMHDKTGPTEYQNIVRGTKYMPFDDIVSAYMSVWLLNAFHFYGPTQLYARYLNKAYKIPYQDFYTNLSNYIQQTPFFRQQYDYTKKRVIEYLKEGKEQKDQLIGKSVGWHSSETFYEYKTATNYYLQLFIKEHYDELIPDDLIRLQNDYCIEKNKAYPHEIHLHSNLPEYILDDNVKELETNKEYVYKMVCKIDNKKEYIKSMYFGRRSGYNKVSIERVS